MNKHLTIVIAAGLLVVAPGCFNCTKKPVQTEKKNSKSEPIRVKRMAYKELINDDAHHEQEDNEFVV